jgi:hypothetical protein
LDKGTASCPKAKEYQKMKVAGIELSEEESEDSEDEDSQSDESEDVRSPLLAVLMVQ